MLQAAAPAYHVVDPRPKAARPHVDPKVPNTSDIPLGEEISIRPGLELKLKLQLKLGGERRGSCDVEPSLTSKAIGKVLVTPLCLAVHPGVEQAVCRRG